MNELTDWGEIVSGEDLDAAARERKKAVLTKTKILPGDAEILEKEGWRIVKTEKKGKCTLEKEKPTNDLFENEVWLVLYKMGFTHMNSTNKFRILLDGNSKQIDVIAFDDETCILVECKSSQTFDKTTSFKQELESIHGYFPDVCKTIAEQFGPKKFRQVFATKNYLIADDSQDMMRINSFGFNYFNQDTIYYYQSLAEHLGSAARYQLLGNLFQGEEISELENKVPAIKGVMGGHDYYSFLIEPARLLKLSYVLHRNKANHQMMPTYQRLIKKDRLAAIKKFLDGPEGFFPNSIIVSIDNRGEDLCFDTYDGYYDGKVSVPGILHLPKRYRSIYVIDGQHRLYGYSNSEKSLTDTVSVVAFVNLPAEDQVKMFMDINETQKKVSKTLRNTLIIDLQWKSDNKKKANEALMLRLAEWLGEDGKSALYGRILTGEDKETELRCITTEYVRDALNRSSFFNEYSAAGVKRHGTIDRDDNDKTLDFIQPLLINYFRDISFYCKDQWEMGGAGVLSTNNSVFALIKLLDDIINIRLKKKGESVVTSISSIYAECEPMILDLCDAINDLQAKEKATLKEKGQGGRTKAWRTLQMALNRKNNAFINDDLQKYIDDNCTDNNPESSQYIDSIEAELKNRFRSHLEEDPNWIENHISDALGLELSNRLATENFKRKKNGQTLFSVWDVISFDEIRAISIFSNNWSSFAQNLLHRKSFSGTQSKASLTWLKDLSSIKAKLHQGKPVTRVEFAELQEAFRDFCEGE